MRNLHITGLVPGRGIQWFSTQMASDAKNVSTSLCHRGIFAIKFSAVIVVAAWGVFDTRTSASTMIMAFVGAHLLSVRAEISLRYWLIGALVCSENLYIPAGVRGTGIDRAWLQQHQEKFFSMKICEIWERERGLLEYHSIWDLIFDKSEFVLIVAGFRTGAHDVTGVKQCKFHSLISNDNAQKRNCFK